MRLAFPTVGLLVAAALVAPTARAQSDNAFDNVDPGLEDAAFIGVVLPLDVGLSLNPVSPNERQQPPAFDQATRRALVWENTALASKLSDYFLFTEVAAAVFMPLLAEWDVNEATLSGTLVGLEALLATSLLTEFAKQLTGRQRPHEYYSANPEDPDHEHVAVEGTRFSNRSFFSGHTSMAFSAATLLTIFAYEYEWLDEDLRWIVPTTSYAAAAFTGYLRIAGDRHWLSDVLVGAFVGTGTTYLVFALRTN